VLDRLTGEGLQGAVLDLRDNAGGALDAAVAVCDLLLPADRTVVETRGQAGALRQRYVTSGSGRHVELPLAVLVNQNSASAAEIMAACLQDHGRAVVVGERTYGKGTVQQLVPLGDKSLLKLTSASFWRPSGVNIHRMAGASDGGAWGVTPDAGYELRLSNDEYAAYRKYRSARDLLGHDASEIGSPQDASVPADYRDKQLMLAVGCLQSDSAGLAL
jgi:carboxyl-terminal processing protease